MSQGNVAIAKVIRRGGHAGTVRSMFLRGKELSAAWRWADFPLKLVVLVIGLGLWDSEGFLVAIAVLVAGFVLVDAAVWAAWNVAARLRRPHRR